MKKNRGVIAQSSIAERMKIAEQEIDNTAEETAHEKLPKNIQKKEPVLFVNGRLNRKANNYIAKNFSLLEGLSEEINSYCKGIDLAIINTLIHVGLEKLKADEKLTMIEYDAIESLYK